MQNWLVNFLAQNGVEVRPELPKLTKMVRAKTFHACKKDNAAAICACVKTLWVVCPKSCAMKSGASSKPSGSAIVWWHGMKHGCHGYRNGMHWSVFSGDFNLLRFRKGTTPLWQCCSGRGATLGMWHHGGSCACLWAQGFQSWCKTRLLRPKFLMQINRLQVPTAPWYSEVVSDLWASSGPVFVIDPHFGPKYVGINRSLEECFWCTFRGLSVEKSDMCRL